MKLFIDTSDRKKIFLKVDDKVFEKESKTGSSQNLLEFIDTVLKKENVKLEDLTSIEVETGPGSFTGLRVGVSVAQALGWSLGIPVNGKDLTKGETIQIKYK
ncbi:tRNA (adenosine(37)-N6)-threonylcarbamoyltransferase complex dimerization subunit type 1 TsaB [Candidatus Woesebacteria bacterium]|nr:tRNA (adenosine(37)-N6)-threonylcarbamoyltransferase complex dimerization subunit type 1 TsaB [Candidatus Woesebacteria bacterium]